jgi:nitroimidazol reductase NimA-like FMN-containing flavoprotein (pyridoxamine 5'-phosphate oxidase superfamily)
MRYDQIRRQAMRRKEFAVEETQEVEEFMKSMSFGFLSQPGPDFPVVTPLNYVVYDGDVCFHGSRIGEKMQRLKAAGAATFCVAREFSVIPSYFSGAEIACPATAFFKSVVIRGKLEEITDPEEKCRILGALMEKLQPEGRYAPFDLSNQEYRKNVKGVSVLRLRTLERTAKFKFGQNQPQSKWKQILESLLGRGQPADRETAGEMQKRCPFH